MQERRDKIDKVRIGGRFDGNENDVRRANFPRRIVAVHVRDPEVFTFAANRESVAAYFAQITAY